MFVYDVLKRIESFQSVPHNFQLVTEIVEWILTYPVLPEDPLYEESLAREPRDTDISEIE